MRPLLLRLEGFTSFAEPVSVDFDGVGLAAIIGPNGAGKSSLVDAVPWALFGQSRNGGDIDSVVSTGAERASVTFEFELAGTRWRVTRTRVAGKRSQATVEVFEDGAWLSRSTGQVRDTDEFIRGLLGMTVETFLATVLVGQGDADRFCAADPAERKRILGEVLGLDAYKPLADAAKTSEAAAKRTADAARFELEQAEKAAADLVTLRVELDAAEERADRAADAVSDAQVAFDAVRGQAMAAQRVETARTQLEALLANHAAAVDAADQRVTRATKAVTDWTHRVEASTAARDRAAASAALAETAKAAADAAAEAETALRDRGVAAAAELAAAESDLKVALSAVEAIDARLDRLHHAEGDGSCWVCARPLDETQAADIAKGLADEAAALGVDALRAVVAEREQIVVGLRAEFQQAREARTNADTAAREASAAAAADAAAAGNADADITGLNDAKTELSAAEKARRSLDDPTCEQAVAIAAARTELDAATAACGAVVPASKVAEAEAAVDVATSTERAARDQVAVLGERLRVAEAAAAALPSAIEAVAAAQRDVEDWATVGEAFGRDGVPAMLAARAVPELEAHANTLLELMSGGRLRVRLATTKQTKSGGERDTLDVVVIDDRGNERPYRSFSGGERMRVDLSIRLGLSQMLAHRSGVPVGMLFLDEAWAPLDQEGVPAVVESLRVLHESGRFPAVYTVTHMTDVAAAFPTQIMVERGPDGSSLVDVVAA